MKVHKKKSAKTKPKEQRLTIDDRVHWVYMHMNANAGRFKEDSRVTALKFHTSHPTIFRQHKRLCDLGCITVDARTVDVRDKKTGRMLPVAFFVPSPPASHIALAKLIWAIEAEDGILPPVTNMNMVEPCVKSGSEPCSQMNHTSADVLNIAIHAVDNSKSLDKTIDNSSVHGSKVNTEKLVENKATPPCSPVRQASRLDRELADARRKLQRMEASDRADKNDYITAIRTQIANIERTIAQEGSHV